LTVALDRTAAVASIQMNSMKFSRLIAMIAAASGACLPLRAELADGVQAIVNDTAITYAQTRDYAAPAMSALQQQYAGQPDVLQQKVNDLIHDSLEQLVERQLILRDFDVEGYHLPDSVTDDLLQQRIREKFGDRITLMKTLQAQGETLDQYRKELREQYIISALRSKNVSQEIVISPYKVETYYLAHPDDFKVQDEIKLRMIVLNKSSPDDTNTVKRAGEILTEIKGGAKFTEMAATYSQGSQQPQGGELDWIETSKLRKELADAAATLKPGQVSDVIDTPDFCYLILVEDRHPAHVRPLTEVRDDIEKTLRAQDQARLEKQWIDSLKKKTFIRYF
jgi:peptidyl-prolyl cis-trans isomerase SurA